MKKVLILIGFVAVFAACPALAKKSKSVDFISLEKDYENLIQDPRYKDLAKKEKLDAKRDIEKLINGQVRKKFQPQAVYLARQKISFAKLVAEEQWLQLEIEKAHKENTDIQFEISKTETQIARHEAEVARMMLIAQQEEADRAKARAQYAEQVAEDRLNQVQLSKKEAESAKRYAKAKEEQAELAKMEAELALEEAESLKKQLDSLESRQTAAGEMMTLGDYVFDSGKATIKQEAIDNFSKVMDFIALHPNKLIKIEGHTDSSGSKSLNIKLSQLRANSVKNLMVKNGIDENRIQALGMGEAHPVASNVTAAGKAKNRRVEIIVQPN